MKFISTRGKAAAVSFSEAIRTGLAPDGGLYVPEAFPSWGRAPEEALSAFSGAAALPEVSARMLAPFVEGDALAPDLPAICREALNFPVPLRALDESTSILELFHGPTAAFKDVGARFLAACVSAQARPAPGGRLQTVLVATSGDTGGAVAAAFFGKPGIEVVVLFPKGRISPRQEKQLTCWGGNVRAVAVRGDFDDCQRLVKGAFLDPWWKANRTLISANSINIGRILPQAAYYASAGLEYLRRTGRAPSFIVPSGNLGNACAAFWARKMGFPIRSVVLACNANHSVRDTLEHGEFRPHPTLTTLANAMDVGNPSNMERLLHLFPTREEFRAEVRAFCVSDEEIRQAIRESFQRWGVALCPHTATAAFTQASLGERDCVIVATAHPAKFESIVEPLLKGLPGGDEPVVVPAALADLLERPSVFTEIDPVLADLQTACGR